MPFEFKLPDVGEGIHEAELVEWLVKEEDEVKADQPIALVETDKSVVEIPSPKSGTILKLYGKVGETLKVGNLLAVIGEKGEKVEVKEETKPVKKVQEKPKLTKDVTKVEASKVEAPMKISGQILATPHTRHLARQMGVDLSRLAGTGRNGRITDEDIKKVATGGVTASTPIPSFAPTMKFEPVKISIQGEVERVPFKSVRKKIAEKMSFSRHMAPHATHMDEVDVTELVKVREKEKIVAKKRGVHLTYLAFIVKVIAAALKNNPTINASLDMEKDEIILKKYYNIGIAVDTDNGLIVPVIKDADKLTVMQIAQEITRLANAAKERKIKPEDLQGGTFTITNVGSLGGIFSVPIVNYPEVAILGVHAIRKKPVVKNNAIVIADVLPLSISFDHRIVDGADAARFLNEVMQHLSDPSLMLVDVI